MGLGTSECGICPAGFGDAETPAAPPTPTTWSRYLGTDGKYAIDGVSGNFQRIPPLKQRIVLAVATALGSSTVQPDAGIARPAKMGQTFQADMDARVRKALRHVTDIEKLMRIESVTIERDTARARVTVLYTDLSTGKVDEIAVEPRGT